MYIKYILLLYYIFLNVVNEIFFSIFVLKLILFFWLVKLFKRIFFFNFLWYLILFKLLNLMNVVIWGYFFIFICDLNFRLYNFVLFELFVIYECK